MNTIELIKDAAFFGGHIPNERLDECRNFFDNVIEKQLTLTDVVVPKGTCCLKPKKIGKVNDMFESWDECKNCGKEIV